MIKIKEHNKERTTNKTNGTHLTSKRYCPPFQLLGVQFGSRHPRTLPKAIFKE